MSFSLGKNMELIDLSHEISPAMPVYPGDEPPAFSTVCTIENDGFVEQRVTLSLHQGTHVDAPSHVFPNGKNIDSFPISYFSGQACVLPCGNTVEGFITVPNLAPFTELIRQSDFVLLQTGWGCFWGSERYFAYPALSPEAGVWLADFALKGVGIDTLSVDPPGSTFFPVHHSLLGREIVIVENLCNLDLLPVVGVDFFCLPLALDAAEASPVRALAVVMKL